MNCVSLLSVNIIVNRFCMDVCLECVVWESIKSTPFSEKENGCSDYEAIVMQIILLQRTRVIVCFKNICHLL